VEVDRNGNIKAQGEEVKKVMVDGKEFFGDDPKVATKNLPADAVEKVQVYDTKSNRAEATGIDDGQRDKTINLQLKDDRKTAWFGALEAGAGTEGHYQSSAKAYRFTPEKQFAALGMLNNITKFGFSFSDYLNFTGGMHGGDGLRLTDDLPIDFGQQPNGLITSGAMGLNYSIEKRKDNRFYTSYLANGINKDRRHRGGRGPDRCVRIAGNNHPFRRRERSEEVAEDFGGGMNKVFWERMQPPAAGADSR
jgi:hypothetical protein